MKSFLWIVLIIAGLVPHSTAQQQRKAMLNDLHDLFEKDNGQEPVSKVIQLIFAKMEKKYPLRPLSATVEAMLSDLIVRRRKHSATKETGSLMCRGYDHAIAGILSADDNPDSYISQACKGATEQYMRALAQYDRALKSYGHCINQSGVSAPMATQAMDDLLSGSQAGSETQAASTECQDQLKDLQDAANNLERWGNIRALACKGS